MYLALGGREDLTEMVMDEMRERAVFPILFTVSGMAAGLQNTG